MAGKGSGRRPTKVPKEVADANYEAIFGKYVPLYLRKQIPDNAEDNNKPVEPDTKDTE